VALVVDFGPPKAKRVEPPKPKDEPKDEPKNIEVPRPKVEPKAEPLAPLEPPKPKPVQVSQPKASEPKAEPKPPAPTPPPTPKPKPAPPQPDWRVAPGREGIEVYSAPSGPVQAWRFRGDTTEHAGPLPPNVGRRKWYTLAGYPGLEGYGLIGPQGVTVEKWRYAGRTQEYTGWPPAIQSPVPYLTVPRHSFGGGS
jgi:hypothetical protein